MTDDIQRHVILGMLLENVPLAEIVKRTGVTESEIENLDWYLEDDDE